jgi:hypothetical protein
LKNTTKEFEIVKAPISPVLSVTNATIKASETLSLDVVGNLGSAEPVYTYSTSANGEYSATKPAAIGTYFVKATIPAATNYLGGVTAPVQFAIVNDAAQIVPVICGENLSFAFDVLQAVNFTSLCYVGPESNVIFSRRA